MSLRGPRFVVACAVLIGSAGCRMGAPIYVWHPPELESTVGHRVALAGISGPKEAADSLQQALVQATPSDQGRQTTLSDAETLQQKSEIRLVSAIDDATSDVAFASVARRQGYDYMLRGEILEDHSLARPDAPLAVSWRLLSIRENRSAGGKPVAVDVESAVETYPDLALLPDEKSLLAAAAARRTFRLITPWIDRERVQLSIPYFIPGSEEVRRGNAAALAGRWSEAEEIWQRVADDHPSQIAAIHNLAIAAAAAQDFSRAKKLARRAIRRQPTMQNKNSLVWIELKQRQYHQSFDLPDPPEGWFLTSE